MGAASPCKEGDSIYGRVLLRFTAPLSSIKAIQGINHTLNQLPCHHTPLAVHLISETSSGQPNAASQRAITINVQGGNHNDVCCVL